MSTLITDEYREMQRKLHENPNYGVASVHYAPLVADVIRAVGATELLDYGAGKGRLGQTLPKHIDMPLKITHYDPAVPEWSKSPQPSPMVACIDVLEHIEPTLLDNVLDDLKRVTLRHGVFTVHTQPAVKMLPDGRNAHLIQQPPHWWLPRFLDRFELLAFNTMPMGFWVFVERKLADAASQGAAAGSSTDMLCGVVENLGIARVLDYGGDQGGLAATLAGRLGRPVDVISCKAQGESPSEKDVVACIDVLQDVEPGRIDETLDELKRLTPHYGVFTIADRLEGRAPRVQEPAVWWLAKFLGRFEVMAYNRLPTGFGVVVGPKAA